jgi:CheY-like chemotaxis protein
MIIDVGQKMLESIGYKVLIAQTGSDALDVFRKRKDEIDLIILDMIMPEMSGGEIYEQMRDIDAGVNILLSSGYSINGQAKEILDRGCNGFIQKPYSLKDLSIKIRELLEGTKQGD